MIKPVESLLQPDERFKSMMLGFFRLNAQRPFRIEDLYELVRPLELGSAVPKEIRQQFDAVRHAFIYSWFSYDLVTLAEGYSYAVLENALRLKAEREGRKPRASLKHALDGAVEWGWLIRDDFEIRAVWGKSISLLTIASKLRNNLAHGKAHLFPEGSLAMLQQCFVIIMKLFPSAPAQK